MKPPLGFVGLGLMGSAMANRLLDAGFALVVHNRTEEKARPLIEKGAAWAENPKTLAQKADIVFSMLSTSEVLSEIALGPNGVLAGIRKEAVHIDCSTVAPSVTGKLERTYASAGCFFLHMPVLGSVPQAADGKLLLFAGEARKHSELQRTPSGQLAKRFGGSIMPNKPHMPSSCATSSLQG